MSATTPRADDSLSAADVARIVGLVDRFEAAWRAESGPRIEDTLAEVPGALRPRLLRELIALEVELRRAAGESPASAEYLDRFPGHEDAIGTVLSGSTVEPSLNGVAASATVGGYRLFQRLGVGGQAATYLARDQALRRLVVVKRYHGAASADRREAVLNEGRSLARVRSPYVARCLAVEEHGDEVDLIVEYLPGRTLAELTDAERADCRRCARLAEQVAEGLAAVHACGLLHRDLKPQNIILGDDGLPRLVDFGLAAPLASTDLESISGSPPYMAPEQARGQGERIDARTDVFGLGAVLYSLLTGQPLHGTGPREEVLERARTGRVEPPRALQPRVPRGLERICLKALEPDPARRYPSAAALRYALRNERRRAKAAPVAALAMVGLLALTAGLAFWPKPRPAPRVESFRAVLYRGADAPVKLGELGEGLVAAREDDAVQLIATLSEPAYAFVIALNTDGKLQLCYPEDGTRRPAKAEKVAMTDGFTLTDGPGLQGFVLVVSRDPLPPYDAWRKSLGDLPWKATRAKTPFSYDGATFDPVIRRGGVLVLARPPEPFSQTCRTLQSTPGVAAIRALCFHVQPRAEERPPGD